MNNKHPELEDCDCGKNKLPANPNLLQDLLLQLDALKSMGPDGIHSRVLKMLADVITRSLFFFFLFFLEAGKCCPSFQEL